MIERIPFDRFANTAVQYRDHFFLPTEIQPKSINVFNSTYNSSVFSRKLPKYLDLSGNQNAGKLSIDSVQHRNKSSLASIKLSRQSSRVFKLRTSVAAIPTI